MPTPSLAHAAPTPQRRELYFFNLFRLLEAGILALVAFTPLGPLTVEILQPLVLQVAALVYLVASVALLTVGHRTGQRIRRQAAIGLLCDIAACACALLMIRGGESGISMFMVFNIGAGSLILTPTASLGFALVAAAALISEYVFNQLFYPSDARSIAEPLMFSVTYAAMAMMGQQLRRQMTESQALADKRGEELANLSELNELVIRRMRTGVLVVDGSHQIRLSNEAAWGLMGNPSPDRRDLAEVAPSLHQSLWHWRQGRGEVPKAMTFAEGAPEVLPRFVALSLTDKLFLIFLDDSRIYSDRAEELTLSTLGRLSASIAHEIRNPLAAISYSTQLLEESTVLPDADRRLLEIIHSQCQRMNGIVQNILGLARRERSQTESLELSQFVRRFVDEYRTNHPLETDVLQAAGSTRPLVAMVDPQHLHQVLTILVHNALTYGREPGKPAQVSLSARIDGPNGPPVIDVVDRGPGIPARVAEQIFAPFYTTSEHGTGLGLYIAKQLCEANLCTLSFQPVPAGGSCFRITLPASQSLVQTAGVAG